MGKRKRQHGGNEKQGYEAPGGMGKAVRSAEKSRVATDSFANAVASVAIHKYHEIVKLCKFRFQQTVMSAFIVRFPGPCSQKSDKFTMKVVSLGVGTKFLCKKLIEDDVGGLCVKDLHGEILAHRAFKAFLYRQIKYCIQNRDSIVFEPYPDNAVGRISSAPMCKLKEGVTFHFYTSSQPCGNACLKKFAKSSKPTFRMLPKNVIPADEHNEKHFSALDRGEIEFLLKGGNGKGNSMVDGTHRVNEAIEDRSYIHTCSDKILRWNVCGLQGSLLYNFLEDVVHLKTCTFGRKFGKVFNERALCCRMQKVKGGEKGRSNLQLNHPAMLCSDLKFDSSVYHGQQQAFFSEKRCLFWSYGDAEPTILDGSTGKVYDSNESCKISKRGFANMFESVCKSWVLRSRKGGFLEEGCTIPSSDLLLQYNVLKTMGRGGHVCARKKMFWDGYNKKPKKRKTTYSCDNGTDETSIIYGTGTWVNSPSVDLSVTIPRDMGRYF